MMNLEGGVKVKVLLLFMITLFSAATVAHGLGTSGNGDGAISCPGASQKRANFHSVHF